VNDPFGRRQLARHILFDEVRERDDELQRQGRDHQHGPGAVRLGEAQCHEQERIDEVACRMQSKLVPLRRPPGQPFRQFVMIDRVESRHHGLAGDQ